MARDRAATLAYLHAELAYEKTRVGDAAASREAVQALADSLDGECPGVIAGAVRRTQGPGGARSPRQAGEEDRSNGQRGDIAYEVTRAIDLARVGPYRQAALAFARRVQALRWSDAMLTTYEHAKARATAWEAEGAMPAVCADLRQWAQSGYTRLAVATKALSGERHAVVEPALRLVEEAPDALISDPLAQYEGPKARAIMRRLAATDKLEEGALTSLAGIGMDIRVALGVTSRAEIEELERETAKARRDHQVPPRGSVVIDRGRTAAGTSYTIWVEGRRRRGGSRVGLLEAQSMPRACRRWVGIVEPEALPGDEAIEVSGEPSVACLSRSHPMPPRVRCDGERRTIESQTLAQARRVRLTLADGHAIVSPVAVVPRRLGGPEGIYYQALVVWASPPVSLTELDRNGKALRTLTLAHQPRCPAQWPFVTRRSVHRIARGSVPDGPAFSILAGSEKTPTGADEVSLAVEVGTEMSTEGIEPEPAGPFAWRIVTGCQPHAYAILYGVLKNARDTVWARGSSGLTRLRRARLPASLHEHGVLAYAAFSAAPTELLVRAPDGKTVHARKLAGIARAARETCEGEAEPAT